MFAACQYADDASFYLHAKIAKTAVLKWLTTVGYVKFYDVYSQRKVICFYSLQKFNKDIWKTKL